MFGLFFLFLFFTTRYTGQDIIPYPVNAFFRIDPFAAISAMLASRKMLVFFWPLVILIPVTFLFGRLFCGWICPMGGCLDLVGRYSKKPAPAPAGPFYRAREILLVFLLVASVFSVNLAGIFDPLSLLIRSLAMGAAPPLERAATFVFDSAYGLGEPVRSITEPLYGFFHNRLLSFTPPVFRQVPLFLFLFLAIIFLELYQRRFWCRNLCPLGALLGWFSFLSPLGLKVRAETCTGCYDCIDVCRMGALTTGSPMFIRTADCTLCYDCVEQCSDKLISHGVVQTGAGSAPAVFSLSRRQFMVSAGVGVILPLAVSPTIRADSLGQYVIRPPGAASEKEFLPLCLRCGECMRVCLTNGLQPALLETGLEGMWSPRLVSRTGYCEYSCTLCGQVCPTGAIENLDPVRKKEVTIGLAVINKNTCIPFVRPEECIVCEEHCPTPEKAIVLDRAFVQGPEGTVEVKQPRVIEKLCIGCGICEYKCPLEGEAAIRIIRQGEDRAAKDSF